MESIQKSEISLVKKVDKAEKTLDRPSLYFIEKSREQRMARLSIVTKVLRSSTSQRGFKKYIQGD